MEKATRNLIQKATQDARGLLEREFAEQLSGTFDIREDGTIEPKPGQHLDAAQRVTREKVIASIVHKKAGGESWEDAKGTWADQKGAWESKGRMTNPEAVAAYLREAAFTTLNRFVALKMLEARGLVQECVSKGEQSAGFREYCGLAQGLAELPDHGYRLYIESLFDELGTEIRVLFDRRDPASLLWPRRKAQEELLSILNREEIAEIWGEDETIGWVYQYFNSSEERKKMRDESAAPRNSRELAVRNQFFTPRSVVEFLTDNTLGRTWYEMRQGQTRLKEQCRYLVRRPDEVFLAEASETWAKQAGDWFSGQEVEEPQLMEIAHAVDAYGRSGDLHRGAEAWTNERLDMVSQGDAGNLSTQEILDVLFLLHRADRFSEGLLDRHADEMDALADELRDRVDRSKQEDLSQDELLKQPVFIPFRAKKDPRDIRILDPACGSGHFLLYAFDLLLDIYEEGWADPNAPKGQATGKTLKEDYPDITSLQMAVPGLILRHNLHGIDIDPRAVQIAALSLWMRAQKAYSAFNVERRNRPAIRKTNIVTAEPMPGEKDMLREFTETLSPRFLGQLVEAVFDKMQLAGEAGSLLKIEDDIRETITQAKEQEKGIPRKQAKLFSQDERPEALQMPLWDITGTGREFWEKAEERIYKSIEGYAQKARNGKAFRRRLFAEDTARGFAFIDLCRTRYDVALMNPPFGDASLPSKPYIEDAYGDTKGDVYKSFVECFQDRLVPAGMLGIISSRTGFFLSQSTDWRQRVVLRLYRPMVLADLGHGVLDAMVETAAYVLRSLSRQEQRDLTLSLVPEISRVQTDKSNCFSIPKYQATRGGLRRHQAVSELEHLIDESFLEEVPGGHRRFRPLTQMVKTAEAQSEKVFPVMTCFRVIEAYDKEETLRKQIDVPTRTNKVFAVSPDSFKILPNASFAYWISSSFINIFKKFSLLSSKYLVASGTGTLDDFRFLRFFIELPINEKMNRKWFPFAKGGSFSPYYFDHYLYVNWDNDGSEMKSWIVFRYGGGHWARNIRSTEHYFRPGLTWPRRTNGLSFRAMPEGCIFADKGPAAFNSNDDTNKLLALLGVMNSLPFNLLVSLQLARTQLAQSYEVGIIQNTPIPDLDNTSSIHLSKLSHKAWSLKQHIDTSCETSHFAVLPALLRCQGTALALRAKAWENILSEQADELKKIQKEIDQISFDLYGIPESERIFTVIENETIRNEMSPEDRGNDDAGEKEEQQSTANQVELVMELVSWFVGFSFGRFDVRIAFYSQSLPKEPEPFDPLPVCSPGMLTGPDGLPAQGSLTIDEYPLSIPWDGIVVDDPGFTGGQLHDRDIIQRLREVFDVLWQDKASDIEQEACEILNIPDLRTYYRRSFFPDHIKRYSKSRRKAPIYWQLATPSASYSVWLYYHRFTRDTFYKVLNEFVAPKLAFEERELSSLRQQYGPDPSAGQRKELDAREAFVEELKTFKEEVARIALLWNPDLNDGVIINFAPLWRLVPQNRPWQKECKDCWDKLVKEEYDWAHLAMHLWPERVVPKCAKDRSLAIAHGLEETFWEEDENGKWKAKKVSKEAVQEIIKERSSPTVKAALGDLLKAPAHSGAAPKRGKKKA